MSNWRFIRVDSKLVPYLVAALNSFTNAESDEDGVSHLDKNVVYAVDVDILDASGNHVIENAALA